MKKYTGLLAFALVLPMFVNAQVVCPRGYVCTPIVPTPEPTSCYLFTTDLNIGSIGNEVTALQMYLVGNGYDIPSISGARTTPGYFGLQTSAALIKYQAAQGIRERGFGPLTRASMNQFCSAPAPQPAPAPSPVPAEPAPTVINNYPYVNDVVAPSTLNTNQVGTWTIYANDPENGPLSYSVDWGDSIQANTGSFFVQNSTFTHAYSVSGVYTVTFLVRDNGGLTVGRTLPVQVITVIPLGPTTYHSVDLNHDWKIDASEVATFQTLYNYRSGTVRTGEYSSQMACTNSIPGTCATTYSPGPGMQSGLTNSADTDHDWRISLIELTRVFELSNATGGYRVQSGTEDGFAPINN